MNISKTKRIAAFALGLMVSQASRAQNVYYSQFHKTDQLTNPALVASTSFANVTASYRRQWPKVGDGYASPTFSASFPFIKEYSQKRIGGVGLNVLQDRTGQNGYVRTTGASLNYAHNISLKKGMFLALGLQGGYFYRKLDVGEFAFGNQWQNNAYDPTAPTNENIEGDSKGFVLLNFGTVLYGENENGVQTYRIGLASYNLNQPKTSAVYNNRMSRNYVLTGSVTAWENYQFSVTPNMRWVMQSNKSQQLNIGSLFHYNNQDHNAQFGLGAWYSSKNAIVLATEVNAPHFSFAVSYDIVTSSLKGSGGAPEMILSWRKFIGKQYSHLPRYR